jgi:hypothetical protein
LLACIPLGIWTASARRSVLDADSAQIIAVRKRAEKFFKSLKVE